jgi:hypothetical protein
MPKSTTLACLLGATAHGTEKREINDFYATDPDALNLFLGSYCERDKEILLENVWECANGGGHLSKLLLFTGRNVKTSDLIKRENSGTQKVFDFISEDESPWDMLDILNRHDLVTNPPFSLAEKFVRRAMERLVTGSRIIFLLRLQFLEGKARFKFFEDYPPVYVYIHSSRIAVAKNADFKKYEKGGKSMAFAWFVWEVGTKEPTEIRWIDPDRRLQ